MNRFKATDRSGSIITPGQAQQLMPQNLHRVGMWIQNLSAADLYICELDDATMHAPSMRISPGSLYEWHNEGVPTSAISIYGQFAAQEFSAREW